MSHDPSRTFSLDELEKHPSGPAVDARVNAKDFNELMRMKPAPLVVNAPAVEGHTDNRTSAWAAAIAPRPKVDFVALAAAEERAASDAKAARRIADLEAVVARLKDQH